LLLDLVYIVESIKHFKTWPCTTFINLLHQYL